MVVETNLDNYIMIVGILSLFISVSNLSLFFDEKEIHQIYLSRKDLINFVCKMGS